MIKYIIKFIYLIFILTSCSLHKDVTLYINVNTGSSVANQRHVYIRVFDSNYNLVGRNANTSNGYAIISSGAQSVNVLIVEPDSNYGPSSNIQSFKEGDYVVHVAINDDGDLSGSKARFELGEKVALKSFRISSNFLGNSFTLDILPSDLKASVIDTVNLSSTDNLGSKDAYCFWLPSKVFPLSGYFAPYQYLSTTFGSFSGTTGSVGSLYSTWFGLVPGNQYSLYCFVDYDGNGFITYNVDYEGGTTVSVGSGPHSLTLKKVVH